MTAAIGRSIPFLLGFGFAFLPAYGPFLGLLFFLAARLSLRRADVLWLAAALFVALPLGFHQGVSGFFFGLIQVLALWLIFRAFAQIQVGRSFNLNASAIGFGLITGLALVVGLGWLQIDQLNFAYKTIAQAIVWERSPALYGHSVLVLGLLMATMLPNARLRLLSLGISALGILVSGSREAAIAWVIVAVLLILIRPAGSKRLRVLEVGLFVLMLTLAAGLGPLLGWGRVGFLVDLVPRPEQTVNLAQGTEIALGDWWDKSWVHVVPGQAEIGGNTLTTYEVTKDGVDGWLRLQQVIPITPGEPYTLSSWIKRPDNGAQPGLQGWGQNPQTNEVFAVVSWLDDHRWLADASGAGRLVDAGIVEQAGAWSRVFVSFIYDGTASPLYWYVGMAPDRLVRPDGETEFAGFQLERGESPTTYAPGPASQGLGLGVARVPYWRAAWQGFLERPLAGWGPSVFPDYVAAKWPDQHRLSSVPSHSHNLPLQFLFERGLFGVAGLLVLLAALTFRAIQNRDGAFLLVVGAVLFANIFDYTLLYGGVIYPLAAVAGWRSASYRPDTVSTNSTGQQLLVRLSLAATDYTVALTSLFIALWLADRLFGVTLVASGIPDALLYALILWPVMAWREGLYPGYGLDAPDELRKQVATALYAGLFLAAGTFLFHNSLPVPRASLVLLIALTVLLLPVGRALSKRVLLRLGWWGRQVIVLGANETGQRVAEVLKQQPLHGLHPTALFDDDPALHGRDVAGVPVAGPCSGAPSFAHRRQIRHAIVTVFDNSAVPSQALRSTEGSVFRHVQFVPTFVGLPIMGVQASSLDTMLALEVRNELASKSNRAIKRALDLIGVAVGGLLISPLLFGLAAAVYLDSRGPIFFTQPRVGQGGKSFRILKFRTMVANAHEVLADHLASNPILRQEWEETHKLSDDPRVTRVGRFLRRYSLDELPQLWNVLRGEMSLVGPRPIVDEEIPRYDQHFDLYKMVRPGMTGYWQVNGRNDTSYSHRVELDAFYVRNWSVWLDVTILAQTVAVVTRADGAY